MKIRIKKSRSWWDRRPIPFMWDGEWYFSIYEAARVKKVSQGAMAHRRRMGYTSSSEVPKPGHPKRVHWEQDFDTITEAAAHFGISQPAMTKRLIRRLKNEGITYDGTQLPLCGVCGVNYIHDDYHLCDECRWKD